MRHAAFLGKSSFILVASSPFNLSSDCLFSTLTWSIAYLPCLIELFYHLANRFTANMQLLAMEELLWPFLWRVTIAFLSIVISRVKQLILTLKILNLFVNILRNRFNPQLNLQRSIKSWCRNFGGPCIIAYVLFKNIKQHPVIGNCTVNGFITKLF